MVPGVVDRKIPFAVRFNSSSADMTTAGNAGLKNARFTVAHMTYGLQVECMVRQLLVTTQHVESHNGEPWNECVDSLCTYTCD